MERRASGKSWEREDKLEGLGEKGKVGSLRDKRSWGEWEREDRWGRLGGRVSWRRL